MSGEDKAPDVVWSADGQPLSSRFDDVYFSKTSGMKESRYVFFGQNQLNDRWRNLTPGAAFAVGETGFGTGLNFLVAWQQWRRLAPPGARLHFVSLEKYPLNRQQLGRALALWPQLSELAESLLASYPPMPARGFHRLVFDQGRVQLTLVFDDVQAGLEQLLPATSPGPTVAAADFGWTGKPASMDAWFLDGFAPAKNPSMWQPEVFQLMSRLSRPGTSFATFTAAGVVRRGLHAAGFEVEKVAGFGHKRHMLRGHLRQAARPLAGDEPSWHLMTRVAGGAEEIMVIGAGLAGCHTARALAERGLTVRVLEKHQVASGASGNSQGVVYAKASSQDQPLTVFNLTALQFACRYYATRIGYHGCGAASGVVHLAQTPKQEQEYRALAERYAAEPDFVRWLPAEETEAECGVLTSYGGLLFSQAGWINPTQLCRSLLDHPNIALHEESPVNQLSRRDGEWWALDPDGHLLAKSPLAVIANATDALRLSQTSHLPVKPIRGQVSSVPASASSAGLRRVLCGKGYIAPAAAGEHCIGATFRLNNSDPAPSSVDDQENLARVAELSPALNGWTHANQARVGFRCASPDYLPLVGPVPVASDFQQRFAALRRNARTQIDATGCYYPGLFVNLGHGSRGLAYTPLCAELLASVISTEPLPLARDMMLRLHPGRFLIRDLQRNR